MFLKISIFVENYWIFVEICRLSRCIPALWQPQCRFYLLSVAEQILFQSLDSLQGF